MRKNRKYVTIIFALAAVSLIFMWTASSGLAGEKPKAESPSLYERLGGVNNIAVVIDDVIERSYVDPVLHANPKIAAAHKRFPKPVYKFNATALACMVMGGPQKYTGRSIKEAHQHLDISEKEWKALIRIFRESMTSFKVPEKEQNEIVAILEGTKGDVVTK
jgi:hemoglobin